MNRFRPLGRAARWRILYDDLLVPAVIGDVVTFDQMGEALDLHPTNDRGKIRSALKRAEQEFLEENGHALKPVRDIGYEVASAAGHIELAYHQQRRATGALERGHLLMTQLDLSGVDANLCNVIATIGNAFEFQRQINQKLDVRQRRLEEALESTRSKNDRTSDEVEALKERLQRLEGQIDK